MIMGLDHQQIKTSDDDQHLKENANNLQAHMLRKVVSVVHQKRG
jgi:hypothetical protein